ncbi:MAG: MBL fold metallo-hydrolase [Cyclobacteriaceae bacterium]|nr:MAG: MBL fold metallo-hydrolase [Cyclobacteriaceae bacterium]
MTTITIWGCRGSLATPGAEFDKYGGNTSCVQITGNDGTILILDAGTGLSDLGKTVKEPSKKYNLLLTHLHMDHIQGMGFFPPFFNPEAEVNIWGPSSTTMNLRTRLTRYMSPPLFPVTLRDLPCKLTLNEVHHDSFKIGPFKISSDLIGHVGPTVGYRIECADGVITYIPDHEPALGVVNFPLERQWTSGSALAANADILIHDAQYSDKEYNKCQGWGHSAFNDTLKFAAQARVKHLIPFHHDPSHTDDNLDQLISETVGSQKLEFKVTAARERAVFKLPVLNTQDPVKKPNQE